MTNYDEEYPHMDPKVRADMEAEDAIDDAIEAEELKRQAIKLERKLENRINPYNIDNIDNIVRVIIIVVCCISILYLLS